MPTLAIDELPEGSKERDFYLLFSKLVKVIISQKLITRIQWNIWPLGFNGIFGVKLIIYYSENSEEFCRFSR